MEKTGALLDVGYLKKLSEEKHKELNGLEKKIWKLAGGDFNINSPKQMGEVLFVKLGLGGAKSKKTATGAYSTNVFPAYQTERNSSDNRRAYGISGNFKIGFHLH